MPVPWILVIHPTFEIISCFASLNTPWIEITGVMCNFTTPLNAAEIPVYAVSTWLVLLGNADLGR